MATKNILNRKDLAEDLNELKKILNELLIRNDVENGLKIIEGCAKMCYEFNFIPSFEDRELEQSLLNISSLILPDISEYTPKANRVLFYDYFVINNRGLSQQYLTAFMELNYEIIYVAPNDLYYRLGSDIINQIKSYKQGRVVVYSGSLSYVERISRLNSLMQEFHPALVVLHLAPWDVIACSLFQRYTFVKRIFINLTDHAFWLGKNCIDVCIEFRDYGYYLSKDLRRIEEHKIYVLPYYPITQSIDSFKGFPISVVGKTIGISGGSGYKFIGDNWKFYSLIKALLLSHEDFIFFLVGPSGKSKVAFENKIKSDGLGARFILMDERYDIFQLLKHSDIFIGSYPFPGALMTQLASIAGLPILTYNNPSFIFSYIDDIIFFKSSEFKSVFSEVQFFEVANMLIKNKEYRAKYAGWTQNGIISSNDFREGLQKVINGDRPFLPGNTAPHDFAKLSEHMSDWYLEIENAVTNNYIDSLSESLKVINECGLSTTYFFNKYGLRQQSNGSSSFAKIKKVPGKIRSLIKDKFIEPKHGPINFVDFPFRSIGSNIQVQGNFILKNPCYLNLGENFISGYNLRIEAYDEYHGERFHPEIRIGDNVIFNTDCHVGCISRVYIGNNVLLASRVYISDHSHGYISPQALQVSPSRRPLVSKGPVIIEDGVWIGEGVCVLPGVTIGENSIVGANAVVTKDIPRNSVAAGNPARILRTL